MSIRFLLDDELVEVADVAETDTLLDHLRYTMCRTGSKEGCAEGDCGACTVLVGDVDARGETVCWRAVNACILLLPMLHGKALLTVESLGTSAAPNPLQSAMAVNGSSQCGFCTPGFVMSLYARAIGATGHDLPTEDVIAGNLCRCTGYGPILAAAAAVPRLVRDDRSLARCLTAMKADAMAHGGVDGRRWFAPRSSDELAELLDSYPDARIVAGATDVGLWVTKGLRQFDTTIFIGGIADLGRIEEGEAGLTLGATVCYADAHPALARLHPDLGELVRRIGGLQVRNAATVCGNIANGSPIGDGPPAFIALGATLTLRSLSGRRTIALEDYFLDYGVQDRRAGEFIERLFIPRPHPADVILVAKLSRRFDSDISAVCGAFHLRLSANMVTEARAAFGGLAATPKRAPACEAALVGRCFDDSTIAQAAEALAGDFTPLSDVRASADYRRMAATSLLWRLWYRYRGLAVSVLELEADYG